MKNIIRIALGTALILLIPLVAMQFTDEVNWTLSDFVVMGALLFSVGLIYEFGVRKVADARRRLILGGVLALAFLYVWAELAVGIFNIPGISGS